MNNCHRLVLLFAVCQTSPLFAQPTRNQLVESLTRFEQQYLNCSFRFDSDEIYVHGPAWADGTVISKKRGLCRRNADSGMWIEIVDSAKDGYHSIGNEIPEGVSPEDIPDRIERMTAWVVGVVSSINVSGHKDGDGIEKYNVSGSVKSNKGRVRWDEVGDHVYVHELNILFGFEHYLKNNQTNLPLRLSELFSNEQFEVGERQLDGKECVFASLQVPQGNISIWFGPAPEMLIQKIEVERTANHDVSSTHKLKDVYGYCMGVKSPSLDRLKHQFTNLKYVEIDGWQCCSGFTCTKQEEFATGQRSLCVRTVNLTDIKLSAEPIKSHSVDFDLFSIPNMTRFHAEDAPNIPYVVNNKGIAKVVNEKTLESLDGVRFDMPKSRSWLLIALAVAVVTVFAGLFFYKKRRSLN